MKTDQIIKIILENITELSKDKKHITVAIDGRCASGKTTIARLIGDNLPCNIVHMDDFFLRPEQRTPKRLTIPGGNVDYERFLREVVPQLKAGEEINYRPFSCRSQKLEDFVRLNKQNITIVEGSYCSQPLLWDVYDYHIFLTAEPDEQLRRIEQRSNKEQTEQFKKRWIPLEELYLNSFDWKSNCDDWFDTTS